MFRNRKIVGLTSALLLASMLVGCGRSNTSTKQPDESKAPTAQETIIDTDVVVVGGGAAGLSAAIEASNEGAKVVLLEKLPMLGGSTLLSGGILYAAESPVQERAGVEESWEDLADYWIEMAEGDIDEEMIRFIAENSGKNIAWLEENGVEFSEKLSKQGISPALRGHTTNGTRGAGFINPLEKVANEKGIEILKSTKATNLITNSEGNVIGAEAEDKDGKKVIINAKSVVLATGGFDRNPELLKEYSPVGSGQIHYSAAGNTGDGLVMAREVGADILSKNGVIGFRGVAENLPYTTPLGGLVFYPNLYVDGNGERFMKEANHYALIYKDMMANETGRFYSIFSGESMPVEALEEGIEKGYVFKAESIEELAKSIDVPVDTFISTVERFNELAEKGTDEDFGNPAIAPVQEGTLYALKVLPATLGTFGGPRVNLNGEVLNIEGNPIKGLYAVGEVANTQLYKDVYPASGTSITAAFVLGRITGAEAAKAAK